MSVRLLKGSEFEEAAQLANLVFRREGRLPMESAFPHIFSDATSHSYGLFVHNRLVTFVGFVPSVVAIGRARLNVYSIGSVCTHPDHAGQGYASTVLKAVIQHAERAEASLILVSGKRELYVRAGCYPFGSFVRYRIGRKEAEVIGRESPDNMNIRLLNDTDLFTLYQLFENREVRFERSVWDTALLAKIAPVAASHGHSHSIYLAERQGKADAFAMVATSRDSDAKFEPHIVEHGGSSEGCAQLFARILEEHRLDFIRVILSVNIDADKALGAKLEGCSAERIEIGNSGTVRIVDAGRLIEQVMPYLRDKYKVDTGSLRIERASEPGRSIVSRKGRHTILTDSQLVSLLFDGTSQLHDVDPALAGDLSQLFPLPFPYVRGLNYI